MYWGQGSITVVFILNFDSQLQVGGGLTWNCEFKHQDTWLNQRLSHYDNYNECNYIVITKKFWSGLSLNCTVKCRSPLTIEAKIYSCQLFFFFFLNIYTEDQNVLPSGLIFLPHLWVRVCILPFCSFYKRNSVGLDVIYIGVLWHFHPTSTQ